MLQLLKIMKFQKWTLRKSRNFCTSKEFSHSQGNFPQKNSTNKKVFQNFFFPDQGRFPQAKVFT